MAQKTLAPELLVEDRNVGIAVGAIGIAVALLMIACVFGLTLYYGAVYNFPA